MKHLFYTDTRIPWGRPGSSRKRRCTEMDCLCADPAACPVACGALPMLGGFGGLRGQIR